MSVSLSVSLSISLSVCVYAWHVSQHVSFYPFANGDSLFGHGFGVGHVVLHDGLEQLVLILSIKRWLGRDKTQTQTII